MPPLFRLFWLRETGCDAGTPCRAEELDPAIRDAVTALAGDSSEVAIRLPYLDRREWRRRSELLAGLSWHRQGDVIFPQLRPGPELRTLAATLALTEPAWVQQPAPSDPRHGIVWREVSATLQRRFREWIPEEYFRNMDHFLDREAAYAVIVYQSARICHGRAKGIFTYDFRDYPECRLTLAMAMKMTGRAIQSALGPYEQRLHVAGMHELARRYAPLWYQDVLVAVRKKPRPFIALLRAESAFIDALVELGMNRSHAGVHHFAKIAGQTLRNVYGMDLRYLAPRAMMEATRVLETNASFLAPPQ